MADGTENARQIQSEKDLFEASDEEILNMDMTAVEFPTAGTVEEEDAVEDAIEQSAEASQEDFGDDEDDAEDSASSGEESEADPESSEQEEDDDVEESPSGAEGDDEGDSSETASDDEAEDSTDTQEENEGAQQLNYAAEFQKILKPFKANGREIQVQSAEEAITLMQMGANYNKKMAAIKPHLKTLKILDKHGINNESELSYLIDLKNKNPQAISKLIKDSGIDPLDMNTTDGDSYKPTDHGVSDQEVALDEVLDSIQDSPVYSRLIDTVGKQWDAASKHAIGNQPALLTYLNAQMENGVYDVIMDEVNRKRALGQLSGLSDLDAYKQVGDSIQARNGFDHLIQNSSSENKGQQTPPTKKRVPPKQVTEDPKLKAKRKAAGPAKQTSKKSTPSDFNPLTLSDEEFEKRFSSTLM